MKSGAPLKSDAPALECEDPEGHGTKKGSGKSGRVKSDPPVKSDASALEREDPEGRSTKKGSDQVPSSSQTHWLWSMRIPKTLVPRRGVASPGE